MEFDDCAKCEPDRRLRVMQLLPTARAGGAERIACSLAKALASRKHSIELVCPGGPMTRDLDKSGVILTQKKLQNFSRFSTALSLASRLRKEPVDVIHAHLSRGARVASFINRLTKIPVVVTVHTARRSNIYTHLATGNNRMIAVSDYVRSVLLEWGVANRYIERIYNGTELFKAPKSDPELLTTFGVPSGQRVVGFVGRIIKAKGCYELFNAFDLLAATQPDVHLVMVGGFESDSRSKIKMVIASKGLSHRVTLLDPRDNVAELMDCFDVLVLPSHRETFGLVVIEAMSRGIPVVATRVGGLPEVVVDGVTGVLVDPDANQLYEATMSVLADPCKALAMGRAGKARSINMFSLDGMATRYESLYMSVSVATATAH